MVEGASRSELRAVSEGGVAPGIYPLGWLWVQILTGASDQQKGRGLGLSRLLRVAWVSATLAPPLPRPWPEFPPRLGYIPFIPGPASSQAGRD